MSGEKKGNREVIEPFNWLGRGQAWAEMSKAAAKDVQYHYTLTAKLLLETKINGFMDLEILDVK